MTIQDLNLEMANEPMQVKENFVEIGNRALLAANARRRWILGIDANGRFIWVDRILQENNGHGGHGNGVEGGHGGGGEEGGNGAHGAHGGGGEEGGHGGGEEEVGHGGGGEEGGHGRKEKKKIKRDKVKQKLWNDEIEYAKWILH
ncbi:unnamed protein product [Cuscuta campestris]|uniref:Uncharacterized protein n=1 Tax=Cuscuta campestris TaxID=132261 RepID=A0A484LHT4_9ASTE|nr:unnamed protein product [Cuscuta campestris]